MNDKITVISGNEKQKKWPKEGDVFYFQLSDDRFGYGMVALGNIDVGPFKNAIVIYIYDNFMPSLDESIVLNKENLLLPPIITDASCWKNGYFVTFKNLDPNSRDIYPEHYFKNPIMDIVFDSHGTEVNMLTDNIPVGRESIQFHKNIIRSIEHVLN